MAPPDWTQTALALGVAKFMLIPLALVAILGLMLAWPPAQGPALDSLNAPFAAQSLQGLPALAHYPGEDGQPLAYRHYEGQGKEKGSVVLLHGSSADSRSMHTLALALQRQGLTVDALDLRGHGASGKRGHIADADQLSRDLRAFVAQENPPKPRLLVGFSSGGGLALHHAARYAGDDFHGLILLAPFVKHDAPSTQANAGWVGMSLPRIIALTLLNDYLGISRFNGLPVLRFALDDWGQQHLTPVYDFNLMRAMQTGADWVTDIAALQLPVRVLVGQADALMNPSGYAPMFASAPRGATITRLPDLSHAELILSPSATAATAQAARNMINELSTTP